VFKNIIKSISRIIKGRFQYEKDNISDFGVDEIPIGEEDDYFTEEQSNQIKIIINKLLKLKLLLLYLNLFISLIGLGIRYFEDNYLSSSFRYCKAGILFISIGIYVYKESRFKKIIKSYQE